MGRFFAILILLLSCSTLSSQENCSINGQVVDVEGNPIPYASIYLPTLSTGSMANVEGKFSISLDCGSYQLKIQSLGYESKTIEVDVATHATNAQIELKEVTYKLGTVDISPDAEDPAYNIIRKAIVMAQYYKEQIQAYETDIYIRSFYDVDKVPGLIKKFAEKEDVAEIQTGDIEETLMHFSYTKPNTVKEKIIARKSGSNDTSRTPSSYINLNFYNLGGQDVINPLSRNSFKVYEFEYINTYFEEDQKIHKIKLIPKRKGGDLMKGFLYINDGLWNVNNVDVLLQPQLFKIEYKQRYNEVSPLLWMPTNHKIRVAGEALGFRFQVQYLANLTGLSVQADSLVNMKIRSNLTNYKDKFETNDIPPDYSSPKDEDLSKNQQKIEELIHKEELTNRETLKLVRLIKKQSKETAVEDSLKSLEVNPKHSTEYADSAFSKSDSLWNKLRDIPLSTREKDIYKARDSLNKVNSGDTVFNKKQSLIADLFFFNGSLLSKNKRHTFEPNGLIVGFWPYFNTVDGFAPEKKLLDYEWNNRKDKFIKLTPTVGYAVARKTFTGRLEADAQYNKKKRGLISISGGRRTVGFNRLDPISDRLNTISTTFFTGNFKKLYQQDYIDINHQIDLINGLVFSLGGEYANRIALTNNSDFQLFDLTKRIYTPNIPNNQEVYNNPVLVNDNIAFTVQAKLEWTPQQFYTYKDNKKVLLKSKYPTFGLGYRKGIQGVLDSESNYDIVNFSIHQSFPFRLIDKVNYHVEAGKFFSAKNIYFADYQNFNTTPSFVIDNPKINGFRLLDYYAFNTKDFYLEGHFSIENDHLILKYLPLLNKTGLDEKLEFSYLYSERKIHYSEAGLSLTNIFFLMDAGGFISFRNSEFDHWAIKLSFYFFH